MGRSSVLKAEKTTQQHESLKATSDGRWEKKVGSVGGGTSANQYLLYSSMHVLNIVKLCNC